MQSKININTDQILDPLKNVAQVYIDNGVHIFRQIPLWIVIGVPCLIIFLFLIWFWYNFLR